jgi:hypothetical protein
VGEKVWVTEKERALDNAERTGSPVGKNCRSFVKSDKIINIASLLIG